MSTHELSRIIKVRQLPGAPVVIEGDASERAALAERFGLSSVDRLTAEVSLEKQGKAIRGKGTLKAAIIQSCAVSGEDFPTVIDELIDLRFVEESTLPSKQGDDGEIEIDLTADEGDEIEYSGGAFDLGEAVAQTLGLAIDPYAEGPGADAARKAAGISDEDAPRGPLADALAALKKD